MMTGDGMAATGKSMGLILLAITEIAIGGKLYGPCPVEILQDVNHLTRCSP